MNCKATVISIGIAATLIDESVKSVSVGSPDGDPDIHCVILSRLYSHGIATEYIYMKDRQEAVSACSAAVEALKEFWTLG